MKSWRPSPITLIKLIPVMLLLAVGATVAEVASDVSVTPNVEYGKGGGRALKLDIVQPKEQPKHPMAAIIYIHGGGWSGGTKEAGLPLCTYLAQRGYFCATIEYRLTGEAIWPAQIEDCKCAVRWMRAHAKEYNIDPNRIGVTGASAGGHLVALLGTSGDAKMLEGKGGWEQYSSRVNAVCDWFGPVDLLWYYENAKDSVLLSDVFKDKAGQDVLSKLVGGPFWERPGLCRQASPLSYVSKDDPPFLIMQGDKDPIVPMVHSQMLDTALTKAGVNSKLIIMKGAGHGFPGTEPFNKVADFFNKTLGKS